MWLIKKRHCQSKSMAFYIFNMAVKYPPKYATGCDMETEIMTFVGLFDMVDLTLQKLVEGHFQDVSIQKKWLEFYFSNKILHSFMFLCLNCSRQTALPELPFGVICLTENPISPAKHILAHAYEPVNISM